MNTDFAWHNFVHNKIKFDTTLLIDTFTTIYIMSKYTTTKSKQTCSTHIQ